MDGNTVPWFQFKIDEMTRHRLYVPDRIRNSLKSRNGKYYVLMGHNNTPFPLVIKLVVEGPSWRCYIEDGWSNFLDENDIRDGDVVEMFYFKSYYFWARVSRNGHFVKVDEDEDIDSSDDEYGKADYFDNDPAIFTAKITKPYLRAGRLYVPVTFARENLNGYSDCTTVQMYMGTQAWNAVLRLKYDANNNIILCFLHRGVRQMIECNFIHPGQTLEIELYSDVRPPFMHCRAID